MLIKDVMPLAETILDDLNNPENGLLATKRQEMEQSGTSTPCRGIDLYHLYPCWCRGVDQLAAVALSTRTVVTPCGA